MIEYETFDEINSENRLSISNIYQKINCKERKTAFKSCFKIANDFFSNKLKKASNLILFNLSFENNKMNRHLGIWKLLEKHYKIKVPGEKKSEKLRIKGQEINYIATIETNQKDFNETIEILDKVRNSIVVFGPLPETESFWNSLFDRVENFDHINASSWIRLADQLIEKDLIGVRLFGSFDDFENGIFIYEPKLFFQAHGEWKNRQVIVD